MADDDARPIIIKRKKVIAGGHHGGAWKVAYADFVTAMMAFFLLMWLLNATTEEQRKGLADYFNPSIPVHRTSGGGDGPFSGKSPKAQQTLAQNGTGATKERPSQRNKAAGDTGTDSETTPEEAFTLLEAALRAVGGESALADAVKKHIRTRVTDEGLVIEVFDAPGFPLFDPETNEPTETMRLLLVMLGDMANMVDNKIAVSAHLSAQPLSGPEFEGWSVTTERALQSRAILGSVGVAQARFQRITGLADRKLIHEDPYDVRNSRVELTMLRAGFGEE